MNYLYPYLLFLLFLSGIAMTNESSPSYDRGLVAYYSFNDCDARDETRGGSDGRLRGSTSCWCGIEGEGLLFNGVDDFVEFPGPVNRYFNTTDFTLSFYFKPEGYLVFQQSLFSKREECASFQMFDLMLDLNGQELPTEVHETPQKYYPGLTPGLDTTAWMHFALVREGMRAYTYINGRLARESFRCSSVDISNEALLSFGNSPCVQSGSARRFKGVLDELRVYGRALSSEEIRELYSLHPVERAPEDCVT